jgi:hypothetical protein
MFIYWRPLLAGLVAWAGGTIVLRLAGERVFNDLRWPFVLALLTTSACVFAWVARYMCRRLRLARPEQVPAVVFLVLPTLLLDAVTAAFFGHVFPNIAAGAAGVFGGWMLACCGGALCGVLRDVHV